MKNNLIGCLSAAVLGAAIALSTPAMAFRGGGGFGGMHGGFGGGGMHFGGGRFGGGGMRFSGGGFADSGFRGGMVTGRSVFVPGGNRFAAAPFAGQRFAGSRFNHFRSGTASSLGTTVSATLLSLVRLLPWAGAGRTITTMPPMAGAKHGPVMAGSGSRLVNLVDERSIDQIFGRPDDRKFKSSMTLFANAAPENQVFINALQKYFGGDLDQKTLARL